MNNVVLIGRLTKDIELRNTQNSVVTEFTLAVNRKKREEADFISCQAWGKTAENMNKYVHKGDEIAISGRIQTGSYEKDGIKHYTTKVIADIVQFLGGSKRGSDGFTDAEGEGLPWDEG